jgi:hypothetical protein
VSTYEDDIAAAMVGGAEPDTVINRSTLRYTVQHQIFDRQTGAALDISSAVLVTVTTPDMKRTTEVFDATRYDTAAEPLAAVCAEYGITLEILDGRVLFADEPEGHRSSRPRT